MAKFNNKKLQSILKILNDLKSDSRYPHMPLWARNELDEIEKLISNSKAADLDLATIAIMIYSIAEIVHALSGT